MQQILKHLTHTHTHQQYGYCKTTNTNHFEKAYLSQ